MAVIEVEGLRKEYQHLRGGRTVAVDGLDLPVSPRPGPPGEGTMPVARGGRRHLPGPSDRTGGIDRRDADPVSQVHGSKEAGAGRPAPRDRTEGGGRGP